MVDGVKLEQDSLNPVEKISLSQSNWAGRFRVRIRVSTSKDSRSLKRTGID